MAGHFYQVFLVMVGPTTVEAGLLSVCRAVKNKLQIKTPFFSKDNNIRTKKGQCWFFEVGWQNSSSRSIEVCVVLCAPLPTGKIVFCSFPNFWVIKIFQTLNSYVNLVSSEIYGKTFQKIKKITEKLKTMQGNGTATSRFFSTTRQWVASSQEGWIC